MVTKDWKKRGMSTFFNSRTEEKLTIRRALTIKMWVVNSYIPGRSPKELKRFKTKSQALKFAKSYMRTH